MNNPLRPANTTVLSGALVLTARFATGLLLGAFLHYLLYRISLPVAPFIYVAF